MAAPCGTRRAADTINQLLWDPTAGSGFDALKECEFRPGGHGRYEWIENGEIHVRQVMPPTNVVNGFSAEQLVAEMDHAGIDWALVHRSPYLGIGNSFVADCVRRFPDRLHALAHVEEWLVKPEMDRCIAKLEHAIRELGLHGLQWLGHSRFSYGQSDHWDDPIFRPWWDAVASLNIPVFFTGLGIPKEMGATKNPLEHYQKELRSLGNWMERYPDVMVMLTHGFNFRGFMEDDRLELPEGVFEAAPIDNPNFNVQALFVNSFGGDWDYPMPQIRPALLQMVERMGADHVAWSTDIPQNLRHYTYLQCIDSIRVNCNDILSESDIDFILGGTMARIMKMDES